MGAKNGRKKWAQELFNAESFERGNPIRPFKWHFMFEFHTLNSERSGISSLIMVKPRWDLPFYHGSLKTNKSIRGLSMKTMKDE